MVQPGGAYAALCGVVMLGSIAKALGGLFSIVNGLIKRGERKAHERRGALEEREKHLEGRLQASRDMKEVENEVGGLPEPARRDLARRFVRPSDED